MDKPFFDSEEFFPSDCEDYNDPFDESSFLVSNHLFSQGSFPSCCNPYSDNTEMVQENDFSEDTFDSYETNKQINDEATSFSNIDSFSKNGINHASSQFSSYASPGNFTNNEQGSSSNPQPIEAINQASENVPYFSNLISGQSQVTNAEIQNTSLHVPHPATSGVQDFTAISSTNPFNMNNPQYSCYNLLQESPNNLQNQVPLHPPQCDYTDPQKFNGDNSTSKYQKNASRKETYKHGEEVQKLKRYPNYNKPFENCAFYKAIQRKIQGNKYKEEVIIIGKKYNEDFKEQIKNKTLPKFKRDFKRNLGLAVWFFEELTPYLYHWMANENII